MANKDHLDISKKGVPVFNEWRNENSRIKPDLSGANLARANLFEAERIRANLIGVRLNRRARNIPLCHRKDFAKKHFINRSESGTNQ
jgi:hypothetical protein